MIALTGRPPYIPFYPSLSCNQSCSICFNRHLTLTDDVTISDFGRMVSIIKNLGIPGMDILGGEPTLHPDLPELMDLVSRSGVKVSIRGNGTHQLSIHN
ncbi:MAG: radical SAM protein [Desulfobacterales bacterium]|jgi:MoaA/NifB/PqqE/SkfB family radical SAM enzyme|nr:radical SAM protein [Desulfobacterales bacterium]